MALAPLNRPPGSVDAGVMTQDSRALLAYRYSDLTEIVKDASLNGRGLAAARLNEIAECRA